MELSKLNNAFFVKVYKDSQRVYVWFGGLGVSIYDLELNEIDYFTLAEYPSIDKIKQSIELHEDELFADEDCTEPLGPARRIWQHWLETGEDLEIQG